MITIKTDSVKTMITFDIKPTPNQRIKSGMRAMDGVEYSAITYGSRTYSTMRIRPMATPTEIPTTIESATPRKNAVRLVNNAVASSPERSNSTNASTIAEGGAKKNGLTTLPAISQLVSTITRVIIFTTTGFIARLIDRLPRPLGASRCAGAAAHIPDAHGIPLDLPTADAATRCPRLP